MTRSTFSAARTGVARTLKMATIVVVSACQPECDDPIGPDVQVIVGGRVTLNGEPVEGITMGTGGNTSVTSATGTYSINVQGEDFPLIACVSPQTEPYRSIADAVATTFACPLTLSSEESRSINWPFLHAPPSVRITTPTDGARILPTSALLVASISGGARLEGMLSPALPPTSWSSSLDGSLGQGGFGAVTADLSIGTHTLTATFTDRMGETASDQVTVEVADLDNQAPTATVTSPESGLAYDEGVALQFAGTGSDPEEGTLTGSALTWTSSQEGDIGTGASFSRVMVEGSHIIVLTATDAQGASGADTTLIHINALPGGTGTIQGTVSIGGQALVEIAVALTGAATANTTTNGAGVYSFGDLGPGSYTITITPPPGADIGTQRTVSLADGQTLTVNFTG